ncbi:MAG: T9SS type B sorting domain-containing protein, partial [Winogradskyella sp.]|nr:T9SS type B sorting domain-containing protein [Winogradskyella sp.]
VIDAVVSNQCDTPEGSFSIDVTLVNPGTAPYTFSINGGAFQSQSAPFTISNLNSGTHTVEISDVNGCGNLVTVTIEAPLELIPTLTTSPSCNNDDGEITVNASGGSGSYSYAISPNPTSISLSGNVFSGVPSGTYVITITDALTSCSENETIVVPEAITPTVQTTNGAVTCFGDNSGSFELTVTNYTGAYTYEVFNDSGTSVLGPISSNTSTNPLLVTGMTAGTYTVVVTETATPFCDGSSTVIISSPFEALALSVSETSNVTCNNNQGTITASANGGWGTYEYELTGDAVVPYSTNNTFANLSAGSYTVNVRDAQGCIVSDNIVLDEPTPITATFTPSTTLLACFGDQDASITVSNVTGGQGSNYTYTLNTLQPTVSTSGPQLSNVFNNLGAGTYNIVITDGYNCTTTSLDITIDEPSAINSTLVVNSTATCTTDATLTLSASGGTGTYEYSDSSTFSPILATFTTSTTFSAAPGTYQYFVRDANDCFTRASNEITVEEVTPLTLNLDLTNATINCAGDTTGVIVAEAQGGLGNYVYTLRDGLGNTIAAVQNTPGVFTELSAGDYEVYVESGDCQTLSQPISITEPNESLQATLVVNNVSCSGTENGSVEINATGGTGIIKYAISPQLNQFFETNIFDNLAPGNYDLIVQDELGCYQFLNFDITEPEPVILSIVANSIYPEVCEGDADGEFTISISGGTAPYSVSLDDYNGTYTTGSSTQTEFTFSNLSGGDHIVYVRDSEDCESEWNITFPEAVRINPEVDVVYDCENNLQGNSVTVSVDDSITDPSDLDYSLNGGAYQTSNVFTNLVPGNNYYVDVRHTNGCIQRTEFFDITTYEPVALALSEGELNEIIANADGGTGTYTYYLNDEDYGDTSSFIINETGQYTVTVIDSNGCSAIAAIEMEFVDICIPNYFTPNGDGVTDTWSPGCITNYPNLTFDIFDRYGRKVATYRAGEYWDGKYNGHELPTGDYWYVVQTNDPNVDRDFVGHFTLYR